jgi:hypothetical protein
MVKKLELGLLSKLAGKTQEELMIMLNDVAVSFTEVGEYIQQNYLLDGKERIKQIKKIYSGYKRRKKFHDYYDTIDFFNNLKWDVLEPLLKVAPRLPHESIELLQAIIGDFEDLCQAKDDSSGCAIRFLEECFSSYGKAWLCVPFEQRDLEQLAQLVANYYFNNGYLKTEIIESCKSALGTKGLTLLEKYIAKESNTLLYVIGLQNNPAKLADAIKESNNYSAEHVLRLATLYIDDLDFDHAIDWILKYIPENIANDTLYRERQNLLIQAFVEDGQLQAAQEVRWKTFLRTLEAKYYCEFMKKLADCDKNNYRQEAMEIISKNTRLDLVVLFLDEVQEYELLSDLICQKHEQLSRFGNISTLRKLSKTLAANAKYLAATLIRRELVNDVLATAKSQYYHYAVSDLKLAMDYGLQVIDWQNFSNNKEYLTKLQTNHGKKYSFWGRINFV